MVLIGQTMLECGMRTFKEVMGLRYVPVANVLKERQPNQSEAIINSQWQLLFRVLSCGWLKKYFDRETIIYCSSSSNIGWIVILALALRVFSVLLARNPKVWGSIPHGDSSLAQHMFWNLCRLFLTIQFLRLHLSLRPLPNFCVFVWKRNLFYAFSPVIHSKTPENVDENGEF